MRALRVGCIGCGVLALVVVVVPLAFIGAGLVFGVPEPTRTRQTLSRSLPGGADGPRLASVPVGRIVLDVTMAKLTVESGPPDRPVRLDADFDSASFQLQEILEGTGELGWVYRVEFSHRSGWLRPVLGENALGNRLRIVIPRGVPFTLEGNVGVGESAFELGGLGVRAVDLDTGTGEHAIVFREPLERPLDHFVVDGGVGALRVEELGNAGPKEARIRHGVGELLVDLTGGWTGDAVVQASLRIGDLRVVVPRSVGVQVDRARVAIGARTVSVPEGPPPPGAPTLRLSVHQTLGELRVSR